MFGIGMNEMLIIAIIALVVIGPRRLPAVARTLGGMMAQFRRATNELRDVVNKEITSHTELNELKDAHSALQNDLWDFKNTAQRYIDEGAASVKDSSRDLVDPGKLTSPGGESTPGVPYGGLPSAGHSAPAEPPGEGGAAQAPADSSTEPVPARAAGNPGDKPDASG